MCKKDKKKHPKRVCTSLILKMEPKGEFDFSNINLKGSNTEGLDLEPIVSEALMIWLFEYWGTTAQEIDHIHFKMMRRVVDLFISKDQKFEHDMKFRIDISIENLPVKKLIYDLESANGRFYSRFAWQLTECLINLDTQYKETNRSIGILEYHKEFCEINFRVEDEWRWNARTFDGQKDLEMTGSLDFKVSDADDITEDDVVQFLRDLRFT